ncbi:hypothetical protein QBC39DRAFT_247626 [Podospora conica]|nr:hypothetical protein QBC39DRAFT_247626 [Schizothecium conicum]
MKPPTTDPTPSPASSKTTPYRQIRAHHDAQHITVYQAYNIDIATAAVTHQLLSASPKFSPSRMTWIKPSWAWMLYRSGYSYKDPGQARILALQMRLDDFFSLLAKGVPVEGEEGLPEVRIQWDPERDVRLQRVGHRSIQIGVPGSLREWWVESIVKIEDVTERARELKRVLDEEEGVGEDELVRRGLVPIEMEVEVPEELGRGLRMG